jgi:hypothetical protein
MADQFAERIASEMAASSGSGEGQGAMNPDIAKAIKKIGKKQGAYRLFSSYYEGEHRLKFASEKFRGAFGYLFQEFADNLCPAVIDSVVDRLQITGFVLEDEGKGSKNIEAEKKVPPPSTPPPAPAKEQAPPGSRALVDMVAGPFPEEIEPPPVDPVTEEVMRIWRANRMDKRAGEAHLEACKAGDAYLIVWPNEEGEPVIFPNKAHLMTVQYDEENPGSILWAAKCWYDEEGRARLNLYYPDRIEKYITVEKKEGGGSLEANAFVPLEGEEGMIKHDYGRVPVFHLANNAGVGEMGRSELQNIIPLQDALNKTVMDKLVAMEFASYPQRWAVGVDVDTDEVTGAAIKPFEPGIDRLWTAANEMAKFGEFSQANLEGFLKVADNYRIEMARVSSTPLHYMMLTTDPPSGEALKTLEARSIKKVKDRSISFGNVWEDAMAFAYKVATGKDVRLSCDWEDPAPKSEREAAETAQIKANLGIPDEQLWKELGYTEEEIATFKRVKAQHLQEQAAMIQSRQEMITGKRPPSDEERVEEEDTIPEMAQ